MTGPEDAESEAAAFESAEPPVRAMQVDRRLLELLVCPMTRGVLVYDAERQELISRSANRAYPIHNGIPVMLIEEARPLDD